MTTEQKAKAYDEALKWMRDLYPNMGIAAKEKAESIFHELCESEDERIKKLLVEAVTQVLQDQYCSNRGVSKEKVIAWLEKHYTKRDVDDAYVEGMAFAKEELEKQGEHKKFRDSIQVGDEVTRNSDGVIVNLSQLKRVAKPAQQKLPIEKLPEEMKTIGESLGFTTQEECDEYNQIVSDCIMSDTDKSEQKPIDKIQLGKKYKCIASPRYSTFRRGNIYKPVDNFLCNLMNLCYECFEPIEDSEQKPTDGDMVEALRTEYEKGRADAFAQMQKEWSEEDEEMFEYTINLLNYNLGCRKWLQSLKERHIWKPSDTQIRALEYIINNAHNTSYSCKIAKELLEQLKKLKGE